MISVDCRDGRKGIGLGFGVGGREMEDTELEEGEACSYQNNEDYDASIDPDIDLSYLDEKLQDVLGHFQKDFEGGVSLESLGAKFGGYGSFLPAYQRSPVGSHPRTPPKVQKYSTLRSPNNLQLEGGRSNNVVSSSASQSVGHQPASTSSTSLPALKAPSGDGLGKQEVCMAAACVEDSTPRFDSINKRSTNVADQKTLKVRIKVGSDNLSTRKNTAIYSGLGLDDSPSSSMDDSHSESEGLSHEPENVPFESPTSILQIMTSFPVHGGSLLSPLSDDLIDLIKKEKLLKEARYVPHTRGGLESFDLFVNGSDAVKGGLKMLGEKNMKPVERNDNSAESKCGNNGDSRNGIGGMSKKESDFDSISCEELVSKTLKLPILSNSYSTSCDMIKSRGTNKKGVVKDTAYPDRAEEGPMEPTFTQEDGSGEKRKATSTGKGLKDRKASSLNEIPVHPNKEGQQKGEKTFDIAKSGSNVSKGRKALNTEIMESSKQKANLKAVLHEQDMRLHPGKELPIPGETKKSKGSHGTPVMEVPKENLHDASSVVPTIKKGIHTENCTSNSDSENVKLRKDIGRNMDRYKDFFGELEEEEEENQVNALEITFDDKLKESDVFTKSLSAINNASKEAPGANNKFDKLSSLESYPIMASNLAPRSGNGPISDVAPATGAPVVIKENWVGCDKCQKWRLLPLGTNPNHLPEKWVCSMLNWLPGLNRCSVSEEETTKALVALYQLPAPDNQNNLQNNPGGYFTGPTLASFRHPDQTPQTFGLNTVLGSGKKQHATINEGPTQLSSSVKKNTQASVKSRSLNDVNSSPLVAEADLLRLSKSSDLTVEKQKHKYKAKQRVVEPHSDGGDTKSLKMRSRKDSDQDSSRASKKIKTEFNNITDEDWASDHSGAAGKVHPSSSSGFPTSSAGKGRTKYSDRTSSKDTKDSRFDATDRLQDSITKPKVKVEVSLGGGSIEMGNTETRDSAKKRKNKESQNESLPSTRNLQDSMAFVKEEFSENDYRKEKKARTRSEGKESSGSKGHGRTDKKSSHMKNQQLGQDHGSNLSQQSLEGMDSLKRDLGYIQGSLAATSSSSKVSGSHKTKSCFQEVKGSPVESVSSSPMRISNPDKLMSLPRDLTVKDDFQNAGHLANGSPKRSYDGEDFGGSDQTRTGKERVSTMAHHGSLECSVRDFHDRDFNHKGSKARNQASSPDITKNQYSVNGAVDNSVQDTQHPSKTLNSDQCGGVERQNDCHYRANGSHSRKSGKGSSSRLKDKNRSSKSDLDMERVKSSDVLNEPHKFSPSCELKPRDGKNKLREKFGDKSDEIENKFPIRKDFTGDLSSGSSKRESQLNLGEHGGVDVKVDGICRKDAVTPKQNLLQECNEEKSLKKLISDKNDQMERVSGRGRSLPLPPSGGSQSESLTRCPRPVTGLHKGNGPDTSQVDAVGGNDVLKVQKQIRKADDQNGSRHISSRHAMKNGHRARDLDTPSPVRRDSSSQAAVALKEARDLKRMADRFKNSGSITERTGLYLQAALKFLHGASLLEPSNIETVKHNEMTQSTHIYSSTAKLCEFCAHEYEKSKDMAAAALAYKCVEVAYMRVVYSSHSIVSRDRQELQTALQMNPPGESPSSSASDVDNLNNPTTVDKVTIPKGVSSPQVAANHVISGRSRTNFVRMLNFTQDIHFAMEASRKSRIALAAANNANVGEAKHGEGISSIKKALDFNFQDIDGLLHLLRFAMEAISR